MFLFWATKKVEIDGKMAGVGLCKEAITGFDVRSDSTMWFLHFNGNLKVQNIAK